MTLKYCIVICEICFCSVALKAAPLKLWLWLFQIGGKKRSWKNSFNAFNLDSFFVYIPFIIISLLTVFSVFSLLILDPHLDCVCPLDALDFFPRQDPEFTFPWQRNKRRVREKRQYSFLSHKQRTLIIHFFVFHLFAVLRQQLLKISVLYLSLLVFYLSLHKHSRFGLNVTYGKLLLLWFLVEFLFSERKAKKQVEKSQYCPLNTFITIISIGRSLRRPSAFFSHSFSP